MNEILDLKPFTNILRLQGIIPCNNLVCVGRRDCIYLKNRHSKRSEYIRLSYRLHNFLLLLLEKLLISIVNL